jgi:hypothetical protein
LFPGTHGGSAGQLSDLDLCLATSGTQFKGSS